MIREFIDWMWRLDAECEDMLEDMRKESEEVKEVIKDLRKDVMSEKLKDEMPGFAVAGMSYEDTEGSGQPRGIDLSADLRHQQGNGLEPDSPLSVQVGGGHYKGMGIQPVEYIQANNLNYLEGNAIKYISRHRLKAGKQDIEKAIHYLQLMIDFEYPDR